MREIKFRVWDTNFKKMLLVNDAKFVNGNLIGAKGINWDSKVIIMQYTGLKDKNGLDDIYEDDIIDKEGNLKGNIYENHEEETDLVVQGFGTKDWCATYKEAVERGCQNAQ